MTNKSNSQSVTVTVNDRGPFVRGRVIDPAAAEP
jgi:rare lipoprotein A (peptidoglycan hydrolase)